MPAERLPTVVLTGAPGIVGRAFLEAAKDRFVLFATYDAFRESSDGSPGKLGPLPHGEPELEDIVAELNGPVPQSEREATAP